MQNTEPTLLTDKALFTFRVLVEFKSDYNVFVARCLETGSVATASNTETVERMILELLVDEVTFAIRNDNLANLYSTPAPFDVWMKFRNAQRARTFAKPMHRAIRAHDNEEVPAEIEVARAS